MQENQNTLGVSCSWLQSTYRREFWPNIIRAAEIRQVEGSLVPACFWFSEVSFAQWLPESHVDCGTIPYFFNSAA